MAGSRTCHSLCWSLFTDKDEFASAAPTEDSGVPLPTLVMSYIPSLAPVTIPVAVLSLDNKL